MSTACAWCDPEGSAKADSHGICERCKDRLLKEHAEQQERKRNVGASDASRLIRIPEPAPVCPEEPVEGALRDCGRAPAPCRCEWEEMQVVPQVDPDAQEIRLCVCAVPRLYVGEPCEGHAGGEVLCGTCQGFGSGEVHGAPYSCLSCSGRGSVRVEVAS